MKKELLTELNRIIDGCKIVDFETARESRCPYDLRLSDGTCFMFSSNDARALVDLTNKVIKDDSKLRDLVSDRTVQKILTSLIQQCKDENRNTTAEEVNRVFNTELYTLPIAEYEVFHQIHGTKVSRQEPVIIGDFTFYDLPKHQKLITEKYHPGASEEDIEPLLKRFNEFDACVSVKVSARDSTKAHQLADTRFELLQNTFRFLISFLGDLWDIGIFSYKKFGFDDYVILSTAGGSVGSRYLSGARKEIDLDSLFAEFASSSISPQELISNIGKPMSNEIAKRITTAIDLYGRAVFDFGKPICFLEAMMAIEALIQYDTKALVNASISAQICEYSAFLLAESYENRVAIEKAMKKQYGIRSKLAHGSASTVDEQSCKEVLYYARNLIVVFLSKSDLKTIQNGDGLKQYIQKLKYS